MEKRESNSVSDTERIAAQWVKSLPRGAVVALQGDLGAGKTAFVTGMAAGLGYTGRVTSPTFNLLHEYDSTPVLYHYDLYRLSGPDDLDDIGFYETLEQDGIAVIEWSERILSALPSGTHVVRLSRCDDNDDKRIIEWGLLL